MFSKYSNHVMLCSELDGSVLDEMLCFFQGVGGVMMDCKEQKWMTCPVEKKNKRILDPTHDSYPCKLGEIKKRDSNEKNGH
jgi:hypothetical protein